MLEANEHSSPFETFTRTRDLRVKLQDMIDVGGFTAQRYFLQQLDCLLEEMSYLALRRIATRYCRERCRPRSMSGDHPHLHPEPGVRRSRFARARMTSRDCWAIRHGRRKSCWTSSGIVSRHYHKIRQRVTVPYEKMSHHLGLGEEDLRTVLANMQRYMHDLNSVVHFSDIAGAFIRERQTGEVNRESAANGRASAMLPPPIPSFTFRTATRSQPRWGSAETNRTSEGALRGEGQQLAVRQSPQPPHSGRVHPSHEHPAGRSPSR